VTLTSAELLVGADPQIEPQKSLTGQPYIGQITVHNPTPVYSFGGYIGPLSQPLGGYLAPSPYSDPEPPQPEPEPEAPGPELRSFDGSFVGYRAWSINQWELRGTGAGQNIPWVPGENKARCVPMGQYGLLGTGNHRAPHPDCHCGFNALARFKDDDSWWDTQNGAFEVLGAIEAWADDRDDNLDGFFIHPTGFRCEYARVILLATSDEYPRAKNAAIKALAAEHGADVCRRDHLEDAAKEHGQLVPDELLEWAREGQESSLQSHLAALQQSVQAMSASAYVWSSAAWNQIVGPPSKPKRTPLANVERKRLAELGMAGRVPRRKRQQKIGEFRKTPGPPCSGRHPKGRRVHDSNGVTWLCTKTGEPGSWEREGPQTAPH
jgi:hypothetical protein